MKRLTRTVLLLVAVAATGGLITNAGAQPLALVHNLSSDSTGLAWVEDTGTLTPFGTSYSNCCHVAGALATLAEGTVYFISENSADGTQYLNALDGSDINQPPAALTISGGRIIALAWDDFTSELRVLTLSAGSLQMGILANNTGIISPLGTAVANCCQLLAGVNTYDAAGRRWFAVGRDRSAGTWHLYTLDADSGVLANTSPALFAAPTQLVFDSVLLARYGQTGGGILAQLDPSTGIFTDLGAAQIENRYAAPGVATFTDGGILHIGRDSASAVPSLFLTDDASGASQLLAAVPVDRAINALFNIPEGPQITQGNLLSLNALEDLSLEHTLNASDPLDQGLTWSIATQATLGSAQIDSGSGASQQITYTPNADEFGNDSFVVQVEDAGGNTDQIVLEVMIDAVNDAPSFAVEASINGIEDNTASGLTYVLSASPGPTNESSQNISYNVTGNSNSALFSVQPSINSAGELSFTPATDASGSAEITVVAMDDGGTANDGVDTSAAQMSTIVITAVNDSPSFVTGADQNVLEDAGPQFVAAWASNLSAGPPDESAQVLSFTMDTNDPSLFSTLPTINPMTGDLSYEAAPNAFGIATVSVTLMDNGGTDNDGADTSETQQFTIEVTGVNDAPSFDLQGEVQIIDQDGPQSIDGFVSNLSSGPANENGQVLSPVAITGNSDPSLFSQQPDIDANGQLSFAPIADVFGEALIEVSLSDDGGTANDGEDTATHSFRITIEPAARADLEVSMTADVFSLQELAEITYTIVVSNHGPDSVTGASLSDLLPLELINASWNCSASPGEACMSNSGMGDIQELVDLNAGGQLTYTLTATADAVEGMVVINFVEIMGPESPTDTNGDNNYAVVETPVGLFSDGLEELGVAR